MLHEIAPHTLSNVYAPCPALPEHTAFYFDEKGVCRMGDRFPVCADYPEDTRFLYLLEYDGAPVYLADRQPQGGEQKPPRFLRQLPQEEAFLGGTALHLWDWYRKTQFCGICGHKMEHSKTERAMVCTHCGDTVYPRISPAVIVLIHNKENSRLLLARGRSFVGKFYSCIAGYLEIGENLEQAVKREALEETGVHLRKIRYFGSQPWPFSGTQMVGFFAEADEEEPIRIQQEELADAGWFDADELPAGPQSIAIANAMISRWRETRSI